MKALLKKVRDYFNLPVLTSRRLVLCE